MDSIRVYVISYAASLIAFLAVDAVWLGVMFRKLYKPGLGAMVRDTPLLPPAGAFYVLYALGVTVLVVARTPPDASVLHPLGYGALLGLVAYGTYDLSNHATLRGWPLSITIADMAWGAFSTAIAAAAGYYAGKTFG